MGEPMLEKRFFTIVLLGILLAGCGPIDTATQPSGEIQTAGQPPAATQTEPPQTELTPLEWLAQSAFTVPAQEPPNIIPSELPEGFTASEPNHVSGEVPCDGANVPCGFAVDKYDVRFDRPSGDQVRTEDSVRVEMFAYSEQDGRTQHLNFIDSQDDSFEFYTLDGHRIVRYFSSVDGRVWISGPYLILIYSGLDTSEVGPWVDTFASLFLVMFPPQ